MSSRCTLSVSVSGSLAPHQNIWARSQTTQRKDGHERRITSLGTGPMTACAPALSGHQSQWHRAKSNYLFPLKALSRHFRSTMISALRSAYGKGKLHRLHADKFAPCLTQLMHRDRVGDSRAYLKRSYASWGVTAIKSPSVMRGSKR